MTPSHHETLPSRHDLSPIGTERAALSMMRHRRMVLAVSGGGDSLAMLHDFAAWIKNRRDAPEIFVVTVDHGLRSASADEAKFVAGISRKLGLPHSTLTWHPKKNASSEDARLARYDLLTRHALDIGATAIVLAHTLDDQAETVLMRAKRMTAESATLGLAGIPAQATHSLAPGRSVTLLRPYLNVRRPALRTFLTERNLSWIDDPSNADPSSERIRTRNALRANDHLPDPEAIARLAALSARSRAWLNRQTGRYLSECLTVHEDMSLTLSGTDLPDAVIENALAITICIAGGMKYKPPPAKLADLISAIRQNRSMRKNVGRAIVSVRRGEVSLVREDRNRPEAAAQNESFYDGRFYVDHHGRMHPFVLALERFRPASDDVLFEAIADRLSAAMDARNETYNPPAQTACST